LTKKQRNNLFEHKNKTRGSLRVWKSDTFYNPQTPVARMKISDGISEALVIQAACTKALTIILNRKGIQPEKVTIEKRRLKKLGDIQGLEYDSIKSIKGDHDHLRLNYSTFDEHGEEVLAVLLQSQANWLDEHKVDHGEYDGAFACIRGKCFSLEDLKRMQKKLSGYTK